MISVAAAPAETGPVTRDSNTLSVSVVRAIAEEEDERPEDLDFVLHEYIETEILDRLQSDGPRKWSLDFEVGTHRVSVNQNGRILVNGRATTVR